MTIMSAVQLARAQRNLAKLGLYSVPIDGQPGPETCEGMVRLLCGPSAAPAGQALADAIPAFWWTIPNRVNMLFAQVFTECAFTPRSEDLRYTTTERLVQVFPRYFAPGRGHDPAAFLDDPVGLANVVYGGRDGNCTPTDGWNFRGRGWPQLSGRANYRAFSDAAGMDLERGPDAMLRLDVSARVTVAFMTRTLGMNLSADQGDVNAVRHLWNGGDNGLAVAQDAFDKLTTIWTQTP